MEPSNSLNMCCFNCRHSIWDSPDYEAGYFGSFACDNPDVPEEFDNEPYALGLNCPFFESKPKCPICGQYPEKLPSAESPYCSSCGAKMDL